MTPNRPRAISATTGGIRIAGNPANVPRAMERAVPAPVVPSADQRQGNYKTEAFTYTTTAGSAVKQLYTANVPWSRVKLYLETAGPVAVATKQQFLPVLSGKGIILATGVWIEMDLARGNVLYIASPTVNRVKVIIQPLPWMEQLLGGIVQGLTALVQAVVTKGGK